MLSHYQPFLTIYSLSSCPDSDRSRQVQLKTEAEDRAMFPNALAVPTVAHRCAEVEPRYTSDCRLLVQVAFI